MQQQSFRAPVYASCWLSLLMAASVAAQPADPVISECLGAYEQSVSLRAAHALRAARAQLLLCAAPTCPADVRNECALRVSEVNTQIPTLVFEALDRARNDLSQVRVSMDGQPLVERLDGSALSVDPGEHRFVFELAGTPAVEKQLVIREGEKDRRERIVLGPEPVLAPPPDRIAVPLAPARETQAQVDTDSTRKLVGAVISVVGVAGLSVALYEQVSAHARYTDSQRAAQSYDPAARASAHPLYEQAAHAQTFALISGGLGLAAAAAGVYLLVADPGGEHMQPAPRAAGRVRPWLAAHSGGLTCAGEF